MDSVLSKIIALLADLTPVEAFGNIVAADCPEFLQQTLRPAHIGFAKNRVLARFEKNANFISTCAGMLSNLGQDVAEGLRRKNALFFGTVGPQDCLFLPIGWLIAEQPTNQDVLGIKLGLIAASGEEKFSALQKCLSGYSTDAPALGDITAWLSGLTEDVKSAAKTLAVTAAVSAPNAPAAKAGRGVIRDPAPQIPKAASVVIPDAALVMGPPEIPKEALEMPTGAVQNLEVAKAVAEIPKVVLDNQGDVEMAMPAVEIPQPQAVETPKRSAVETPKDPAVETPKEAAVESFETPKDPAVETPKESAVEKLRTVRVRLQRLQQ
eukprot:4500130-Amphidinium_carterae.1